MKGNVVKYIFIVFVIAIISFAVYKIYFQSEGKIEENESSVQVAVEDIAKSNDIRIGISNFDNINPLITNHRDILHISKLIFEPLIELNENYEAKLCLATECSKINDTNYIIKIDTNKTWQDGSPLVAKDIQFTVDRLKEGKSIYSYNVQNISGLEIIDASTVKITLSKEQPFFEYCLTFPILSNNQYLDQNFYETNQIPIGTGMYKIESIDTGSIKLTKNEKWWNIGENNPKADNIIINLYGQIGEVYNSFKIGNIDFFNTINTNLEQYIGTIGYGKNEYKGRNQDYISMNCNSEVLKYPEVRRAIAYLIDKENIISSIYNNQKNISDFPLDYGSFLYNGDNYKITYNEELAKKTLTDAGWEYKNKRWQKKENRITTRISLKITVDSSNEERVKVAENIVEKLNKIGLRASINKVNNQNYQTYINNKNYDIILDGVANSYSPDLSNFFGEGNLANYTNTEMNTLLNEVKNISDINLLKEKYQKILEIYISDMPYVFLYRNKNTCINNQTLSGEIKPTNYNIFQNFKTWVKR